MSTKKDLENYRKFATGEPRSEHPYVAFLGMKGKETLPLLDAMEQGLPYSAFERLSANLAMTAGDLAAALRIPARTLARRRESGTFSPEESDRIVRLSRLFANAVDVFDGDPERAAIWFGRPVPALGHVRPIDLAATDVGSREIETTLGRIEWGIFS